MEAAPFRAADHRAMRYGTVSTASDDLVVGSPIFFGGTATRQAATTRRRRQAGVAAVLLAACVVVAFVALGGPNPPSAPLEVLDMAAMQAETAVFTFEAKTIQRYTKGHKGCTSFVAFCEDQPRCERKYFHNPHRSPTLANELRTDCDTFCQDCHDFCDKSYCTELSRNYTHHKPLRPPSKPEGGLHVTSASYGYNCNGWHKGQQTDKQFSAVMSSSCDGLPDCTVLFDAALMLGTDPFQSCEEDVMIKCECQQTDHEFVPCRWDWSKETGSKERIIRLNCTSEDATQPANDARAQAAIGASARSQVASGLQDMGIQLPIGAVMTGSALLARQSAIIAMQQAAERQSRFQETAALAPPVPAVQHAPSWRADIHEEHQAASDVPLRSVHAMARQAALANHAHYSQPLAQARARAGQAGQTASILAELIAEIQQRVGTKGAQPVGADRTQAPAAPAPAAPKTKPVAPKPEPKPKKKPAPARVHHTPPRRGGLEAAHSAPRPTDGRETGLEGGGVPPPWLGGGEEGGEEEPVTDQFDFSPLDRDRETEELGGRYGHPAPRAPSALSLRDAVEAAQRRSSRGRSAPGVQHYSALEHDAEPAHPGLGPAGLGAVAPAAYRPKHGPGIDVTPRAPPKPRHVGVTQGPTGHNPAQFQAPTRRTPMAEAPPKPRVGEQSRYSHPQQPEAQWSGGL